MTTASSTLPTLTSQRLTLRWLTQEDVGDLFRVFSDPQVMRYWSRPPMTRLQEAQELRDSIEQSFHGKTLFQWGVARREDDRVIGTCNLAHIDSSNRRAELGYALGREFWRHGYMTEALDVLLHHAFETMGLHRLEADVDPRNEASIRVLDRLGFIREGLLRERWLVGGETQDSLLYGLLAREWRARMFPKRAEPNQKATV